MSEQVKIEGVKYLEHQSKNVLINVHLSDQFREIILVPMNVEYFKKCFTAICALPFENHIFSCIPHF